MFPFLSFFSISVTQPTQNGMMNADNHGSRGVNNGWGGGRSHQKDKWIKQQLDNFNGDRGFDFPNVSIQQLKGGIIPRLTFFKIDDRGDATSVWHFFSPNRMCFKPGVEKQVNLNIRILVHVVNTISFTIPKRLTNNEYLSITPAVDARGLEYVNNLSVVISNKGWGKENIPYDSPLLEMTVYSRQYEHPLRIVEEITAECKRDQYGRIYPAYTKQGRSVQSPFI